MGYVLPLLKANYKPKKGGRQDLYKKIFEGKGFTRFSLVKL